ncbi:mechanosensitive ion channel family protein [Rhodohalobacter sp. 8-1]|uniref:mechanosensitive ion channel family protein n=1 Tax=Rhodohalobacter sp. 8-1 TaxID=3131972 RepID=UPI0030EB67F0
MSLLESLVDAFYAELELFFNFLPRLLIGIIIFIVIYLVGKVIAAATIQIISRGGFPETYHTFFRKMIKGIFILIATIVFLNLIGYNTLAASLVAGGGLTAVMLGFAFKDIGENFLAGFFLAFSRPFTTDDLIETEGIMGNVESIELRHTHIRTAEGCDVYVPSSQLFTKPLFNYTRDGLRRGSFTVGIDYSNDSGAAAKLLLETTQKISGVLTTPEPIVQIKAFDPGFVELQVFFWINAKDQEKTLALIKTQVMDSARKNLRENGFTISADISTALYMSPLDVNLTKSKLQST